MASDRPAIDRVGRWMVNKIFNEEKNISKSQMDLKHTIEIEEVSNNSFHCTFSRIFPFFFLTFMFQKRCQEPSTRDSKPSKAGAIQDTRSQGWGGRGHGRRRHSRRKTFDVSLSSLVFGFSARVRVNDLARTTTFPCLCVDRIFRNFPFWAALCFLLSRCFVFVFAAAAAAAAAAVFLLFGKAPMMNTIHLDHLCTGLDPIVGSCRRVAIMHAFQRSILRANMCRRRVRKKPQTLTS